MRRNGRNRTKIIVVSVILVVLWAAIGVEYVLLSRAWQAKTAAAHRHPHPEASPTTSPGAPDQQPLAAQTRARGASLLGLGPPPGRDPFRPVIPPRTTGAASASVASAPEEQELEGPPLLPPPMPAEAPSRSSAAALRITGIVLGTPPTAVLRHGDNHYIVRVGDSIADHLRVQAIARSSVTLHDGKNAYVLRLGQ